MLTDPASNAPAPSLAGFPRGFAVKVGVEAPPFYNVDVARSVQLLEQAHRIAGMPPATITDWFRNELANLLAGGEQGSQHERGTAFDLRADMAGALVAQAWATLGGVVVDETRKIDSPHWHLQLYRAA